jgi:hypothetical protein
MTSIRELTWVFAFAVTVAAAGCGDARETDHEEQGASEDAASSNLECEGPCAGCPAITCACNDGALVSTCSCTDQACADASLCPALNACNEHGGSVTPEGNDPSTGSASSAASGGGDPPPGGDPSQECLAIGRYGCSNVDWSAPPCCDGFPVMCDGSDARCCISGGGSGCTTDSDCCGTGAYTCSFGTCSLQ